MENRDVDDVDPAPPTKVPESITLAERWRLAGVKLKERSPGLYRKVFEMLVTCGIAEDEDEPASITESCM